MSREEREALLAYVRLVADRLNLRDWTVRLSEEDAPVEEGVEAICLTTYGRRTVTVKVAVDFIGRSREEQRATVVHELLHPHLTHVGDTFDHFLFGALAPQVLDVVRRVFQRDLELAVDALTGVIAPTVDLPDWPK